jgi:hypothetical protein
MAQLLARGPDATYVEATASERRQFATAKAESERELSEIDPETLAASEQRRSAMNDARDRFLLAVGYDPDTVTFANYMEVFNRLDPESEAVKRYEADTTRILAAWADAHQRFDETADLTPWNQAAKDVLRFLAEVCGMVLRGHIQPADAYEALGAEIARNGGAIRTLLEDKVASWLIVQPGLKLRVLVMIDLMWAEGAQLGELETQPTPKQAAEYKQRSGSGERNRKRAQLLARRMSGRRAARRIERHLRKAESPASDLPWESLFSTHDPVRMWQHMRELDID